LSKFYLDVVVVDDIGTISMLLSILPSSGVSILVGVVENTLPTSVSLSEVAMVGSAIVSVGQLADTVLQVVRPLSDVNISVGVGVSSLSVSSLNTG
jgi:hypothetical protein